MALLPNPPTPTSHALSGGTWVSGPGNTQTSASTGAQYAEFIQWLTIDYSRNPVNGSPVNPAIYRGLDQLSSVDVINVTDTELHFIITSHTSCRRVLADYTTSAYYQPQKFQLQSNKVDKAGHSYGEVDGSANLYVFGPQGSVATYQPFINRVPWDDAVHTAYSITDVGSSHGYMLSVAPTGQPGAIWGTTDITHKYEEYLLEKDIDARLYPHEKQVAVGSNIYSIVGGSYNTSAERGYGSNDNGIRFLTQFIEDNCNLLDSSFYAHRFAVLTPGNSWGFSWPVEEDRLPRNPYYKTSRHDYS